MLARQAQQLKELENCFDVTIKVILHFILYTTVTSKK